MKLAQQCEHKREHRSDAAVSRLIHSKCCVLEEELKTVIATARSLEAQVEKVRRALSTFPDVALLRGHGQVLFRVEEK